jgi:hypothetical protein
MAGWRGSPTPERRSPRCAASTRTTHCQSKRLIKSAPDFVCIGAQKAGTTWLYQNLNTHPSLWLPKEKEIHYFDEKAERAERMGRRHPLNVVRVDRRWLKQLRRQFGRWRADPSLADLRWYLRYFLAPPSDAWYVSLFEHGADCLTGEITPGYSILSPERVAHVRRLAPEVKIIFLMRNPIERSWSHAAMQISHQLGADERTTQLRRHFRSQGSRVRTDYMRTLEVWQTFFPAEQIFAGFLEDVHFHPNELLSRVCSFLGVTAPDSWPKARTKTHVRNERTVPTTLASELATIHADLLGELARRFGGYADWWRFAGEQLVHSPAAQEVAYPLHEGPLWCEWAEGKRLPLQSGVLSDMTPPPRRVSLSTTG